MKTKFKSKLIVLISILLFISCSKNNDQDEECVDTYWLASFTDCESLNFNYVILSIEEGLRVKDIINSASEECFTIEVTNNQGKNVQALVRKDTDFVELYFFDCSEFCILCNGI